MAGAVVAAAMTVGSAESVSAQGAPAGGGGAAAQAPAPPPIVAYRKAMMQTSSQHQAALRALLSGQVTGTTDEDIEMHVGALVNQGKMFPRMWPAGSTHELSRATEDIWTKPEEFSARLKAFADAGEALKKAADTGDNTVTMTALTAFGQTCGACHTPFRKPAPPAPPR